MTNIKSPFLQVKEETQQERTLVTGVCNSRVLAVNPDREEIAEIVGRDPEDLKEPSYIGETRDGTPNVRVDIWMKPVEGTTYYDPTTQTNIEYTDPYKLAIFLTEKEVSNKDNTKNMYINGKIQTTWAESEDAAVNTTNSKGNKWFSSVGVRIAKEGEDQLYDFFSKYINANLKDDDTDLQFNDYDAFLSGDVSELQEIVKAKDAEGKTINVLLGVRDGKYQEVYSHSFERGIRKSFNYMMRCANADYNGFKAEYQNDSLLQAYIRPSSPSSESVEQKEDSTVTKELF